MGFWQNLIGVMMVIIAIGYIINDMQKDRRKERERRRREFMRYGGF